MSRESDMLEYSMIALISAVHQIGIDAEKIIISLPPQEMIKIKANLSFNNFERFTHTEFTICGVRFQERSDQ